MNYKQYITWWKSQKGDLFSSIDIPPEIRDFQRRQIETVTDHVWSYVETTKPFGGSKTHQYKCDVCGAIGSFRVSEKDNYNPPKKPKKCVEGLNCEEKIVQDIIE